MQKSVPPGLVAGIAAHESGHRFIRGADLLHVLAEGVVLVAVAALLAGVLIDGALHLVVESRLALLQLRQLILADGLPRLLVKIGLFIVLGELQRSNLARQHLGLGLPGALPGQSQADGVDPLVEGLVGFVLEHVLQFLEEVVDEGDGLRGLGCFFEVGGEVFIQRFQDVLIIRSFSGRQQFGVDDGGSGLFLQEGLLGFLLH